MSDSSLEFFDGFAWAVPIGFRSALAGCRFDVGDILYDSPDGYSEPWMSESSELRYSIQVQSLDSEAPVESRETAKAFEASWSDSASVTLHDHQRGTKRSIATTQGRIYSVAWKGDIAVLDVGKTLPPCPKLSIDIRKELNSAAESITRCGLVNRVDGHGFLLRVNHAVTAQRLKARKVEAGLRSLAAFEKYTFAPRDLELSGEFCPTIFVHCYTLAIRDGDRIASALKPWLYKPAKDRKTEEDRFSLKDHGWLFALGEGPD